MKDTEKEGNLCMLDKMILQVGWEQSQEGGNKVAGHWKAKKGRMGKRERGEREKREQEVIMKGKV